MFVWALWQRDTLCIVGKFFRNQEQIAYIEKHRNSLIYYGRMSPRHCWQRQNGFYHHLITFAQVNNRFMVSMVVKLFENVRFANGIAKCVHFPCILIVEPQCRASFFLYMFSARISCWLFSSLFLCMFLQLLSLTCLVRCAENLWSVDKFSHFIVTKSIKII